jgi:hypothetical protein
LPPPTSFHQFRGISWGITELRNQLRSIKTKAERAEEEDFDGKQGLKDQGGIRD